MSEASSGKKLNRDAGIGPASLPASLGEEIRLVIGPIVARWLPGLLTRNKKVTGNAEGSQLRGLSGIPSSDSDSAASEVESYRVARHDLPSFAANGDDFAPDIGHSMAECRNRISALTKSRTNLAQELSRCSKELDTAIAMTARAQLQEQQSRDRLKLARQKIPVAGNGARTVLQESYLNFAMNLEFARRIEGIATRKIETLTRKIKNADEKIERHTDQLRYLEYAAGKDDFRHAA